MNDECGIVGVGRGCRSGGQGEGEGAGKGVEG
jgi:hypothetical protein